MKAYEAATDERLPPHRPIYARIDGRSFSRFTRGMRRPFDADMSSVMVETTKALVGHTHARIGYTQSDEISLVWLADNAASQTFFDGRVQKLCSVLSGYATAAFTRALLASDLRDYADRLPHFDCRVVSLPTTTEAANMFLWRALDARKNAVSMAARAHFSAKELHGKRQGDMRAMLAAVGVEFEDYPAFFKQGTFVQRVAVERRLSASELESIPERHRPAPDALVTRSEVRAMDMPPLWEVSEREALIFAPSPAKSHSDAADGQHGMNPNPEQGTR